VREHIGANDIANQVSMMRSAHSGAVMLVEGVTDKRLYGKMTDPECEIIVCHSKDNVRIASRELFFKRGDGKIVGIMDADMDRLNGIEAKPPLFLTDSRDSEIMMISSSAFDSVLWEYGDEERMEKFVAEHGSIRDAVMRGSFPAGLMMLVSSMNDLGLSFKDLDHARFINPADLSADVRRMIDEIVYNSHSPGSLKRVRSEFSKYMNEGYDERDVCRGHDAVEVLLIGLKRTFGAYNSRSLRPGELAGALRLAFGLGDIKETELYRKTSEWCSAHGMKVWLTSQ